MDHKKLRAYRIKRKISDVNYELELPNTIRIYPVFYVALLEPVLYNIPIVRDTKTEVLEGDYKVESIIDLGFINKKIHYLVK